MPAAGGDGAFHAFAVQMGADVLFDVLAVPVLVDEAQEFLQRGQRLRAVFEQAQAQAEAVIAGLAPPAPRLQVMHQDEIGRASCRERVCLYV